MSKEHFCRANPNLFSLIVYVYFSMSGYRKVYGYNLLLRKKDFLFSVTDDSIKPGPTSTIICGLNDMKKVVPFWTEYILMAASRLVFDRHTRLLLNSEDIKRAKRCMSPIVGLWQFSRYADAVANFFIVQYSARFNLSISLMNC